MDTEKGMNENEIAEKAIGLAIKVHAVLGPGLLESAYEKALAYELNKNGFNITTQQPIQIVYEGVLIEEGYYYQQPRYS
jgi:GxxExxY protein